MSESVILLFEDSRGVYIPQNFAEEIRHEKFTGYDQEDLDILLDGPDNELYWEIWDRILDNAEHEDDNDNVWRLFQDGDVWIYCDQLMDDEEFSMFVGEI